MKTLRKVFSTVGLALCIATCAQAQLIHRYSFNDGKADDSVGKINGKLNGGAKVADGKLAVNNTGKPSNDPELSYLSFSERILPKSGSATIEIWFTSNSDGQFSRIFDFGRNGQGYIFLTDNEGNDTARAAITSASWGEETQVRPDNPVNDNKPHMAAVVIDAAAGKLRLFVDGKEAGSGEPLGDNALEKVTGNSHWLGRSLYDNDAGFSGSYDELRIFDSALNAEQINSHFKAGPNEIEMPKK